MSKEQIGTILSALSAKSAVVELQPEEQILVAELVAKLKAIYDHYPT